MSTKSKSPKRSDVHVKVYLKNAREKRLLEAEASKVGLKLSPFLRNLAMEAIQAERRTA